MLLPLMPHDYIQANTNGRLHAAHEPSIAPTNRGFLYGDGVFETLHAYGRKLFHRSRRTVIIDPDPFHQRA